MTSKRHVTVHTDGGHVLAIQAPAAMEQCWNMATIAGSLAVATVVQTNNRMELMGPIKCLESLKESCRVTLYSDSRYVVDAVEKGWASKRWQANGWMRNKKEQAINPDLWAQLLALCEQHDVEFRWVRGHAGNTENERCDQLAVQAAQR